MTEAPAVCALMMLLAFCAPPAVGKCRPRPEVRAKITLFECTAVTFGISNRENPVPWPNRLSEQQVSGALISARVEESELVWKSSPADTLQSWTAGSTRKLFVPATNQFRPDNLCPATLPSTKRVTTVDVCCDTGPSVGGLCIAPASVTPVLFEQDPWAVTAIAGLLIASVAVAAAFFGYRWRRRVPTST